MFRSVSYIPQQFGPGRIKWMTRTGSRPGAGAGPGSGTGTPAASNL